jgi:hypothetical protein
MSGRQPGNVWLDEPRAPIVTGMVDAEIVAYYERGLERDRSASGRQRINQGRRPRELHDLLLARLDGPACSFLFS